MSNFGEVRLRNSAGTNHADPDAAGQLPVADFRLEVSKGNVPGHSLIAIVGETQLVQTTFSDIFETSGNFVDPTIAETWEIVSSSANDTAAGTGIQSVTLNTLALDGSAQTPVTIATNGGTVAVTGTHFRINGFTAAAIGTARGGAIGTVTLQVASGGAVRAVIPIGSTSAFQAIYTVPLGSQFIWDQSSIFAPKGEDIQLRSQFQFGGTGPYLIGATSSNYQSAIIYPFVTSLPLTEKSELRIQAKTDLTANSFVSTVIEGYLIENAYCNVS